MKKSLGIIVVLLLLINPTVSLREYKQIVSLAPSITENLYELECEKLVKGITSDCPKGETKKSVIGTFREPDIEKIVLLSPDLIIATKDGNNKTVVEKLMQLGFEVYVIEIAETFSDICDNYYNLANKLNKIEVAIKTVDMAKYILKQVHKKLNRFVQSKLLLLWVIGTNPLYTAGNTGFINDYNYYIKTINVCKGVNKRYFAIDIDNVVELNPDVIVFVNIDPNTSEIKNWNKYKNVNAVKNNKIFTFNSKNIFLLTPLTFAKSVEKLVEVIYGDLV